MPAPHGLRHRRTLHRTRRTTRASRSARSTASTPRPDEPDYDAVEQLYIDPEECIDCDACVEACPVDACFAEDQLPDEWQSFIQVNADYFKQA